MQRLISIPERLFIGMNDRDKPDELDEGYVAKALNVLLGDNKIVKGPGTTRLFDMGFGHGILGAISTQNEVYIVCNEPGDNYAFIYRWTGSGNPVAVSGANLTKDLPVNFVDTGSAVYVLNGTDAVGKLVGAVYTTVAAIPIGKCGLWLNNRLFITQNLNYKSRLYYSDADAPETHGGDSYIDIFPTLKSDNTGLGSIGGTMVIGKMDNIITFTGYTEDDFTVKQLTDQLPNFGITSHRSIVNTGNDLLFMSFGGQVPHIRSIKRTTYDQLNYGGIISGEIEGTMNRLNKERLDQVAAGFDGRYAWWSVPYGSSTVNNYTICYDTVKEGWTVHDDIDASVWFRTILTGQDRLCFCDSAASKAYYINPAIASRDSAAISWEVQSRNYRPKTSKKNKFKYTYIITNASNDAKISFYVSPDGYTNELQETISQSSGGSVFPFTFPFFLGSSTQKKQRVDLHTKQAYTLQITLSESSTNQVEVSEWDTYYYSRGLRDAS
jgi:hypothetical protein